MIEVMGLQQNVKTATHRDGHILDQIIMETSSKVEIKKVEAMDFLSDHVILNCTLGIDKPSINKDAKLERNWKKLDAEEFFANLYLNDVSLEMDDLEGMLKIMKM